MSKFKYLKFKSVGEVEEMDVFVEELIVVNIRCPKVEREGAWTVVLTNAVFDVLISE